MIGKFIGGGVTALFGAPAATAQDAPRALRAGLRLLASVAGRDRERSLSGKPPVRVGIGIHHGPVLAGVLGGDRLEFTVLGDAVDVASRLGALTSDAGHDLVASVQTSAAARIADPAAQAWRPLGHRRDPRPSRGRAGLGSPAAGEVKVSPPRTGPRHLTAATGGT